MTERQNEALQKLNQGIQESRQTVQQRTMELARDYFVDSAEALRDQVKENRETLEDLPDQIPGGRDEAFQEMFRELMDNYSRIEDCLQEAQQNVSNLDTEKIRRQGEIEATDAARREAKERGVDLTQVEGTGADGRIIVSDVVEAAERMEAEADEEGAEGATDQAQQQAEEAVEGAQDAAGQATDQAQQVAGQATDQAQQVAGQAQDAAGQAVGQTMQQAQDAGGQAQDTAGQAVQGVQDTVGGLTGGQQDGGGGPLGGVTDQVGQVADQAQGVAGQATDQVQQAAGQAQETVGYVPEQAVGDGSEDRSGGASDEPRATSAARRKAEELGVDLSQIEGTGSGGLITIRDVVGS